MIANFLISHTPIHVLVLIFLLNAAFSNSMQVVGLSRHRRRHGGAPQGCQKPDSRHNQRLRKDSFASHAEDLQTAEIRLRIAGSSW